VLRDLFHPRALAVFREIEDGQEERPAVHHEIHVFWRRAFDERRAGVILEYAFRPGEIVSSPAETCGDVADKEMSLGIDLVD
jgi:hypothetical protein